MPVTMAQPREPDVHSTGRRTETLARMNVQPERDAFKSDLDDSVDLVTEARRLRRRLNFWRRVAWIAVSAVALVILVVWTRGKLRQDRCLASLKAYLEQAERLGFDNESPELLPLQWLELDVEPTHYPPDHYLLFVQNWLQRPAFGEKLPLAVCRESHPTLITRGRHVLRRTAAGDEIVWLTEEQVAPIAEAGREAAHRAAR